MSSVEPADVRMRPGPGADVDDMAVFVDRLAAAGSDRPTALAATQVRRRIDAGAVPPGIRKLAEALAASVTEPPSQRRPADEPGSVVAAMAVRNLIVLADHDTAEVAAAVAALLADGRRVVVTGQAPAALDAIRSALPADVADRLVDRLPTVAPAELRELRRLVVTDTPARRARPDQVLPAEGDVPPIELVTTLCEQLYGVSAQTGNSPLDSLLGDVEPERLEAVASVARQLRRTLAALGHRHHRTWTWDLLSDLVHQRHRATFDRLCEEVAQVAETVTAIEGTPPVSFVEPLTSDGVEALFSYLDYLESGGRARPFFRPVEQREVQPVLSQIRVAGQVPATAADVTLILRHRELAERTERIEKYCAEIGIPPLHDHAGLDALGEDLAKVAAASRSMAAIRHDVLFLRTDSPIPPPDVDQAQEFVATIIAFVERAPTAEADRAFDALADELAALAPALATAPEHDRAVAALRARDAASYAEAVDALGAARRELRDSERQATLLAKLRGAAPTLAAAWTKPGPGAAGLGMACFLPVPALLSQLPSADSADVVLVLGAAGLGVERLLLAAVAPRMVAVAEPGASSDRTPSVLSVLRRAGALVIRAGSGSGRVVPLARAVPEPRQAQVG